MSLPSGTHLGTYEVIALLGSGGMGEVYRARDTTLGRDVALKTLPESVTHDAERLARFRREAQVLASLNHPHVASIYGFEEASGQRFLVLELIEGETLAARIERGPLRVQEAIAIAQEIADAPAAAHEKGVIHRDLKPANIAITTEDRVKVLDFGPARHAEWRAREPSTLPYPQNRYRIASWMSRRSPDLVMIRPKFGFVMLVTGPLKFGWFRKLNTSMRS